MTIVVMVCRSGDEPLSPGARAGYSCAVCGARLQVSPKGLERMAATPDIQLLCNSCGVAYGRVAEEMGLLAGTEAHPYAAAQLERGNQTQLARWMRELAKKKAG